jgi:dihydropteroate synthase
MRLLRRFAARNDIYFYEITNSANREFYIRLGFPHVCDGNLNVTPDSFSGDGIIAKGDAVDFAVQQAVDFIENGAGILDVGGESTRPGSAPVNVDEEMERVIPVIEALHKISRMQLFQ